MKKIVLNIVVILLKIVYLPLRFLKVKNKVVYMSRESNSESIDFKRIREELERNYPEYKNIVLTKKIENGVVGKIAYAFEMLKQMYHLATSKVIILDTYCIIACVLPHKKETKVIQIWHALGAIKKFGYQTIGTKAGSDETTAKVMCMHKNYDYVLAPSSVTAEIYEQAFNISEDKIKYIGIPRIDYILEKNEENINKIYKMYPILKEKENIVYVPTFRKGEKIELDELIEKIDTDKYNLVIKLHPLDLKEYSYKEKEGVIYDQKCKTYDLLKIADKVVTDYSSLSIEASLLDVPIYFYTYDIEKYREDTGINFDFENEPIGKYKAENTQYLIELLNKDYDYKTLKEFKEKYISVDTNKCTEQLVEFIVRLIKNEEIESIGNEHIKEKQNI